MPQPLLLFGEWWGDLLFITFVTATGSENTQFGTPRRVSTNHGHTDPAHRRL